VLLVPRGSLLAAASRAPTPAEIAALPLLAYHPYRANAHAEGQLRGVGAGPRVVFRTDDNGTVQAVVLAGVPAARGACSPCGTAEVDRCRRTVIVDLTIARRVAG
jgi:hypothetical protein